MTDPYRGDRYHWDLIPVYPFGSCRLLYRWRSCMQYVRCVENILPSNIGSMTDHVSDNLYPCFSEIKQKSHPSRPPVHRSQRRHFRYTRFQISFGTLFPTSSKSQKDIWDALYTLNLDRILYDLHRPLVTSLRAVADKQPGVGYADAAGNLDLGNCNHVVEDIPRIPYLAASRGRRGDRVRWRRRVEIPVECRGPVTRSRFAVPAHCRPVFCYTRLLV